MKIPDFKQSDKKYLTLKTSTFISLNIITARTNIKVQNQQEYLDFSTKQVLDQ